MTNDEILSIRRRALEEAAQIADTMAEQNRATAQDMHRRSGKQARLYGDGDIADQTKISAQVLDACAEEAACIAIRIRQLTIAAHARDDGPVSGPDEARPESHDRMRALRRARSTLTAQ